MNLAAEAVGVVYGLEVEVFCPVLPVIGASEGGYDFIGVGAVADVAVGFGDGLVDIQNICEGDLSCGFAGPVLYALMAEGDCCQFDVFFGFAEVIVGHWGFLDGEGQGDDHDGLKYSQPFHCSDKVCRFIMNFIF